MKKPVDRTLRYQMKYNDDGSWEESCQYGPEYEQKAARLCLLEAGQFCPYCGEDTKGIYGGGAVHWIMNQFSELKAMMPNGKLMWEIQPETF